MVNAQTTTVTATQPKYREEEAYVTNIHSDRRVHRGSEFEFDILFDCGT